MGKVPFSLLICTGKYKRTLLQFTTPFLYSLNTSGFLVLVEVDSLNLVPSLFKAKVKVRGFVKCLTTFCAKF